MTYFIFQVDVDTRSCPLNRTASLSLSSFKAILAPREHSENTSVADPREYGYTTQPTSVCLHTYIQGRIYLLRDHRPIFGIVGRDLRWQQR